jgi:hypothetical protein
VIVPKKPKVKKVEFLGGPFDGRVLAVFHAEPQYTLTMNPLVHHIYLPDEQHTGKGVRTVYRHTEVRISPLLKDRLDD